MDEAFQVKATPRVLVADDNPAVQRLIEIILVSLGCEVRVFGAARDARAALADMRFDLAFLDLDMAPEESVATVRAIRELGDDRAGAPIVALTDDPRGPRRLQALAAGAGACLGKPLDVVALTDLVGELIGVGPSSSRSARTR